MSDSEPKNINPNSLSAEVGRRLRDRRHERGRTLAQTASDAAISSAHLGEIETGESFCSLPVLLRLSRALEYPMAELLPKIGGHRVRQAKLGGTNQSLETLSHEDLDLDVLGIQLGPGESYVGDLDRRQAMLFVVEGKCEMAVGTNVANLSPGDAADIINGMKITVSAVSQFVGLLVQGHE